MELTDFQLNILKKSSETRGYGGYAAASCRRHLERAWKLKTSMPEISIFLAITAEEEAATAIFHALKMRNYDNADKLKGWDHKYKAGVYPFLRLVGDVLIPSNETIQLKLYFDTKSKAKINNVDILRIAIPMSVKGDREYCLIPEPPLGFVSTGPSGKTRNYTEEIKSVASEKGIESIYDYIKGLANERNKMLYATDSSLPEVKDIEVTFRRHLDAALLNLTIYLLIEPHKKQSLPQEALNAYIKILNRIEEKEN